MDVFSADWMGICRRAVAAQRTIFATTATSEERTVYEGVGEGGDHTLAIDRRCEAIVTRPHYDRIIAHRLPLFRCCLLLSHAYILSFKLQVPNAENSRERPQPNAAFTLK